jgi:hypothetical protein
MHYPKFLALEVLIVLLAMTLAACSTPAGAQPVVTQPPSPTLASSPLPIQATFTDPFAYCEAVGTIDVPDARYTGVAVPESVVNGYKKAAGLEASSEPMDMFQKTTVWRCMNHQVVACNVGANLPCSDKANVSQTPSQDMIDFCKANPSSDVSPMSVTGHATIYDWRCNQGAPERLAQIAQVDSEGYLASIWNLIEANVPASPTLTPLPAPTTTPEPTATAPVAQAIQPLPVEVCDGEAQAMAHYLDVLEVTQSEAPINDFITGKSGTGCQGTVTGTGVKFKAPDIVLKALERMLVDEGWTEEPKFAAGGPTGIGGGYRKGNQVCLASVIWLPGASANCPSDQPISTCKVKPEQQNYTITLNCGVETP